LKSEVLSWEQKGYIQNYYCCSTILKAAQAKGFHTQTSTSNPELQTSNLK